MDFAYDFAGGEAEVARAAAAGASTDPKPRKVPQESLNEFWDGMITKTPGKVFQIFPRSLYANLLPPIKPDGAASRKGAAASYQAAADECRAKVKRIVRECRRTNEKFTDPDFDIESDWQRNCLKGLSNITSAPSTDISVGSENLRSALTTLLASKVLGANTSISVDVAALQNALNDSDDEDEEPQMYPATAHRVDYIFDDPSFVLDGFSSSDVQQGANGDCWWVAAVATLCSKPELMEKICVERDAECGVYGFVFYRDGEWISTVVDDSLYMARPDYDAYGDDYDATGDKERKYKERYQTGSESLYFAKCADPNETWLPLLEKAYAKVHGDYDAIQGGDSGEAVEDMTGGVTSSLTTSRVLSKDKLWQELLNVNKHFIFAASSPAWGTDKQARRGLALNHAYSILKAVEEVGEDDKKVRLVLIRNPWGKRSWNGTGEWSGPWSDGSKEWTPYWMKKLNHRFGDDGEFWMSYQDLCRKFTTLHRTRLFDENWLVVQQWTSVHVSWVSGYLTTKFVIEVKKAGTVVIVLSQLDSRYFKGLLGQYTFNLHFLLQEANAAAGEHIVRARGIQSDWYPDRSISAEINLEPGNYEVLPKITATRRLELSLVEDVVKTAAEGNPQKLRQIGLNYDIAHAKGGFEEEEAEKKKKKEAKEKKAKEEQEKKSKKEKEEQEKKAKEEEKKENEKEKEEKANIKEQKDDKRAEDKSSPVEETKGTSEAKELATDKEPKDKPEDKSAEGAGKAPDAKGDEVDGLDAKDKDDDKPTPEPAAATESEQSTNPWNAVAVIGLRVYSKDPELMIKLVKPKDPEEAATLDVDGVSGAGATA